MCGIAFWSKSPTTMIGDARALASALLVEIESRGRMAAGVAWHGPTRSVWWQKQAMTGSRLGKQLTMSPGAPQGILHTRFATKGDPKINTNNHPITRPGIVMVHNGMIRNDDEVFDLLGCRRIGQVDSEAIAAALLARSVEQAFHMCRGTAAVAWMNVTETNDSELPNEPIVHAVRAASSPLVIGFTETGDAIGASTEWAVRAACRKCGIKVDRFQVVPEWTYVTVTEGVVKMFALDVPDWACETAYSGLDWSTNAYTVGSPVQPSRRAGLASRRGAVGTSVHELVTAREAARDRARWERQERLARDETGRLPIDWPEDDWADADFSYAGSRSNLSAIRDELDGVLDEEDLSDLLEWHAQNDWRSGR